MYTLSPDEKATPVMAYTQNSVIRGETVNKQAVRVSTWFRTEGVPDYLNLHNLQWITITGGMVKPMAFSEMFLPIQMILGFHIVPPAHDPLDYDEHEANRMNSPLSFMMGMFHVRGTIRTSMQTDVRTSLLISRTQWLSVYEAAISSPHLPQMPLLQVPMLIVRPMQVSFIFSE